MKRDGLAALAACVIVLGLAGCATTRPVGLKTEMSRPHSHIHSRQGETVVGYVDAAAVYHEFNGTVRLVPGDSLEFVGMPPGVSPIWADLQTRPFRIPRDSVSTIFVSHIDPVLTTLAVVSTSALLLGVAFVVALATKESCPFIYSWDGERYVFDGEPYGGAIMRSLERTDWSELEHLVPDHGRYRLLLTNEVDETQHTNSLALMVVEHAPGTRVVMDRAGRPLAFRTLERLVAARDEDGRNLLPWLREADRAAWYPDLAALARRDTIADTRNHVTLEFPRPPGRDRACLVTHVANSLWGSHMIRSMLAMQGSRVRDFYAATDGSESDRRRLLEWIQREEVFSLFLEVKVGERWMRQDFIPGGGPFVSEDRAVPVDLSGVTGDRVEIRIHPPIGFWSLDSFQLGWDEGEVRVTEVAADSGSGPEGVDVVRALGADDSLYVDFPTNADRAWITFAVPPAKPGMQRTVFARTRGWYDIHLHGSGTPEVAALGRLMFEPGYVVRRGVREYAEYRRTGLLRGTAPIPAGAGGD